ncbi:MAG TPA: outer membrane beta-barrel domain-containing protein [Myxococcales bacterium]|jgi:outer membrane beta-barrel protein|nr:outer membrane beta-barrel domain-containing protein [Myxococcales bacterium]
MTRAILLLLFTAPALAAQEQPVVERIHVLEKRPFTEAGRWELSLFGNAQVNPKFTVHAGLSGELAYHLKENFALQLSVSWYPVSRESSLSEELINKASVAPETAEALLLQGAVLAGLELMPVYGKLNVFDGKILRLGVYINAGVGAAKTQLQLRPSGDQITGRSFGDAGYRPMGSLGVGLRAFVSERFTVRLELRDLVYSGFVSKVNGCNHDDALKIAAAENAKTTATGLSGGCNESAFGSTPAIAAANASSAGDLLRTPSAEVINNLAFQGGVSWLF